MAFKKLKYWFDVELAKLLSEKIQLAGFDFESKQFIKSISKRCEDLELKDRVELIADELFDHLESDYMNGVSVLKAILGPENEEETGMFSNYYWIMPIAKYVEKYGLDHFSVSMDMLEEITKRNTSEYAIRPFLEANTNATLSQMLAWSKDSNKHVRRLSSEGLRPRLPWAKKLDIFIRDPNLIIPILENLKDDRSRYVQKSVANCINDILKDNFEIGKEIIDYWNKDQISSERMWIIKHAVRNYRKKKEPWALAL